MQFLPNPPPMAVGAMRAIHLPATLTQAQMVQQQELEMYFAEKNIQHVLARAVEKLLLDRPENPVEYLIGYLVETYPEQAGRFRSSSQGATGSAPSSQRASPASSPPQRHHLSNNLRQSPTQHSRFNQSFVDQSMLSEADNDDFVDLSEVMNQPRMPSPQKASRRAMPAPVGPSDGKVRESRRGSISAAPLTEEEKHTTPLVFLKSEEDKKELMEWLPKHWVAASLTSEQREKVVDAMELVVFNGGDVIISQGDEHADHYFVVKTGVCSIIENDTVKVRDVTAGEGFGELALLYNRPRCASVVASSERVELWRLDRTTFRVILVKSAMEKRERHCEFLRRVPLLQTLEENALKSLADALQSRTYVEPGENVVTQGDRGSEFFIIEKGSAEVIHDGEVVDVLHGGDYFGEIALLDSSGLRAATVRVPLGQSAAAGGVLTVLSIRREVFVRLLGGSVRESLRKKITSYRRTPAKPKGSKTLRQDKV